MANKLKPYCEQANCQNFHVWNGIAVVSMLHGYSRKRHTSFSFLAIMQYLGYFGAIYNAKTHLLNVIGLQHT